MHVNIPHRLGKQQAVDRIKQLIEESRVKIKENASDVEESWQDNMLTYAFTAQGQQISGTLTVEDDRFDLYAKLPLALRLFEGTIERMIQQEAAKIRL